MRVHYQVLDGIDRAVLKETVDEMDALSAAIFHLEERHGVIMFPKVRVLECTARRVRDYQIYTYDDIPELQERILDFTGANHDF